MLIKSKLPNISGFKKNEEYDFLMMPLNPKLITEHYIRNFNLFS